jgi:alpha-tubulin suppressor-like RCC1 family protein
MSFVDLPAHVALTILRRLDARDLCALRATCRAFDAALVETAAFEATRARAPWLAAPRPREGPERAPASAKREDESWLDLLRFAELAAAARLPRVVANEDVTAVVDREGRVHVWGPVVDAQGHERDDVTPDVTAAERAPNADAAKGTTNKVFLRASRCVAVAAGHACSFGAGGHRGGLRAFRNVAGIDTNALSGFETRASRPPEFPYPARVGVQERARLFFRPRIVSVAAGRMHALAAAADGSLWSWGNDAAGQLGLGGARGASALAQHFAGSLERLSSSPKSRDRARRMRRDRDGAGGSPRAASPFFGDGDGKFFPGGGGGVGGSRAFETSTTGRVSSFDTVATVATAWFDTPMRRVERFSESPSGTGARRSYANSVVSVAASRHGSACVAADGALFCWGSNRHGALGLGDDLDRDVPTRVRVCASGSDDDDVFGGASSDSSDSSDGNGSDDADDDHVFGASDEDARSASFSSRARSAGASAFPRFPGALSDTDSDSDSDSDADRALRAATLDPKTGGKGKTPERVPSGARARRRETASRRAPGHKKKQRDAVVTAFSYGARHAAAVTSRGELFCWGDNRQGQCGRAGGARGPDAVLWPTRTELPPGSSDEDAEDDDDGFDDERLDEDERLVRSRFFGRANAHTNGTLVRTRSSRFRGAFATDVAAGATHTLALDASGRVWSFGAGHGLAPGDPADGYDETMYCPREGHSRRPPERARGIPRAVAVAAGARHSAVVVAERRKRNGEENDASENDASEKDASEKDASSSERVGASGAATRRLHVYTWGANDANQLGPGFGDRAPARPTPTRVATFRTSYVVRT